MLMSFRRLLALAAAVVATLLLAIVLYLALADRGRHRGLVEDLVARRTNRAFTIGGAFELEVLPSVSVVAEDVRLANAEWGSEPSMVTIGRVATEVSLWSLVSGPVHVRSLELSDVSVLLEKNPDGEANWVLGDRGEADPGRRGGPSRRERHRCPRLAAVFDVTGLPAGGLEIRGHLSSSPEELRLEGMTATLAGTEPASTGHFRGRIVWQRPGSRSPPRAWRACARDCSGSASSFTGAEKHPFAPLSVC